MAALLNKLVRLCVRFDAGFVGGRLVVIVPLIAVSYSGVSQADYAQFAADYHWAMILSILALYGSNEAFIVIRDSRALEGAWQTLALGLITLGGVAALNGLGVTHLPLEIVAFLVVYRSLYFYLITVTRSDPWLYCIIGAALVATCGLILLDGYPSLWTLLPLGISYGLAVYRIGALGHVISGVQHLPRYVVGNRSYCLNQLVAAAYVQMALVLFSLVATDEAFVAAIQFVYLLNFATVLMHVLYRLLMIKVAEEKADRISVKAIVVNLSAAFVLGAGLTLFATDLEALIFDRSVLQTEAIALFLPALLVYAGHNVVSAQLVGSGRVHRQFQAAVISAALLAILILGFAQLGWDALTVPVAIPISLGVGVLIRIWMLRQPETPLPPSGPPSGPAAL